MAASCVRLYLSGRVVVDVHRPDRELTKADRSLGRDQGIASEIRTLANHSHEAGAIASETHSRGAARQLSLKKDLASLGAQRKSST